MPTLRRSTWDFSGMFTVLLLAQGALLPASVGAETAAEKSRRMMSTITWQDGPCTAKLGDVAEIDVPPGFRFTGPNGVRVWDELNGNPPNGGLGVLVPIDFGWSLNFRFDNIGYVNDSQDNNLDAIALLREIRQATDKSNSYRRQQGWTELHVIGWEQKPLHDAQQHKLTWALRGHSSDGDIVNYNTRILGRGGVMSANLVISPEAFGTTVPLIKGLLTGFRFNSGHRYTEWQKGDQTAQHGLGALVLGGGVAVAAKTGLLAKLAVFFGAAWKPGILAAVALFAWLKRRVLMSNSPSKRP